MIHKVFYISFITFFLLSLMMAGSVFAKDALLPDGTPVVLRLSEEVNTASKNIGEQVSFYVVKDVVINGDVFIKSGTPAYGFINVAEKEGILGKEGKIGISLDSTQAVDGKRVEIRSTLIRTGEDKLWLSAGLAYAVCPVCGLMKGGKPGFSLGTEVKAYTENDILIQMS